MRIIIWGHKLYTNTFGYVNYGYYKAFQKLGYETLWLDNNDTPPADLNSDTFFMTEGQVDQNIPLIKGATYALHHCDIDKYVNAGARVFNYCNYLADCEKGLSPNYEGNTVEKISDFHFFDEHNKAIYQPWATDLFPEEINEDEPVLYDPNISQINYVGTFYEELPQKFQQFSLAAARAGKNVTLRTNISFEENKKLIQESYISVDIRAEWHKTCGYIPCRIWKNLSYGKPTGTNSPLVKNILGDYVIFDPDPAGLFGSTESAYSKMTHKQIREIILYIKENHTYINRANNLLDTLELK